MPYTFKPVKGCKAERPTYYELRKPLRKLLKKIKRVKRVKSFFLMLSHVL